MEASQSNNEHSLFEDVHEILRNSARRHEEIDRIFKDSARRHEEIDRMFKDSARRHEEIDRMLKDSARRHEEIDCMFKDSTRRHEEIERILKDSALRQEEAALQQAEAMRCLREELDSIAKDSARRIKKIDRLLEANALQMQETDRKIGKLGGRLGEIIEYMVLPNLLDKFRELGFVFTKAYPHADIKDEQNQIITEVDITLENGDKVMLVEVKTKPTIEDIKEHIQRMEKVCLHGRLRNDERKYLGAMAGMIFNTNQKAFALKNGFYVVEPSGETFKIIEPAGSPREW